MSGAGIASHYEYQYFEIRSCPTLLLVQRYPLPLWCCRICDGPATRLPHLIATDVVLDLLFVSCLGCSKSSSQVAVLCCSSPPHLKAVSRCFSVGLHLFRHPRFLDGIHHNVLLYSDIIDTEVGKAEHRCSSRSPDVLSK